MSKDVALFVSSASLGFVLRGLVGTLIQNWTYKRMLREMKKEHK